MLICLQMIDSAENRSKFETIYLLYRDYMFRVAFGILNNEQDAEDAVHSAFVCIAENMNKVEQVKSTKTKGYILTIVRNNAIDIYRKKQSQPHSEYLDSAVGVQRQYDGDNELAKCMLKLPERYRNVIILRYCYGYEMKEIAKVLNISYQNALKIEQRAKTKLRALCQEEGIQC